VKFITCVVPQQKRPLFAKGQEAWSALSNLDGFVAQTGGWSQSRDDCAVIVAYWENETAYNRFMRDAHDDIFKSNSQEETYSEITVTLFEGVSDTTGAGSSIGESVLQAEFIRLADCRVRSDRIEHFLEVQETVWKPGMAGAAGMLEELFARSTKEKQRFLVTTLWEKEGDHTRYREGIFRSLSERAAPYEDCVSIDGILVKVERSWRVAST